MTNMTQLKDNRQQITHQTLQSMGKNAQSQEMVPGGSGSKSESRSKSSMAGIGEEVGSEVGGSMCGCRSGKRRNVCEQST